MIAINEAMARRFFGDANPLGRRLQWGDRPVRPRIVAIVRDVKAGGPRDSTQLRFYIPYLQLPLIRPDWIPASVRYLIRTAGEPSGAAPLLRSIVAAEDPQLSIARLEIGPELVSRALARERSIRLLGIFSVSLSASPASASTGSSTIKCSSAGAKSGSAWRWDPSAAGHVDRARSRSEVDHRRRRHRVPARFLPRVSREVCSSDRARRMAPS